MNELGTFRSTLLVKLRSPHGLKNVNFDKRLQILAKYFIEKKEPTEPFLKSIFEAKDLSNVASIRHGKQNEKVVRSHYARKMQ